MTVIHSQHKVVEHESDNDCPDELMVLAGMLVSLALLFPLRFKNHDEHL